MEKWGWNEKENNEGRQRRERAAERQKSIPFGGRRIGAVECKCYIINTQWAMAATQVINLPWMCIEKHPHCFPYKPLPHEWSRCWLAAGTDSKVSQGWHSEYFTQDISPLQQQAEEPAKNFLPFNVFSCRVHFMRGGRIHAIGCLMKELRPGYAWNKVVCAKIWFYTCKLPEIGALRMQKEREVQVLPYFFHLHNWPTAVWSY